MRAFESLPLGLLVALGASLVVSGARAQTPASEPPEYQLSVETEVHESEEIRVMEARRVALISQAEILRDLAIGGAAVTIAGVVSIAVVAADRIGDPCTDCDDLSDYGPGIGVTVIGGLVVLIGGIVSAVLYTFAFDLAREIEALREQVEPTFALQWDRQGGGGSGGLRISF